MNEQVQKRKTYFIDKQFQTRFILRFCALVAIGGLLATGLLYLLAGKSTTVSIVNSRVAVRSTADFLLPILIQTVIIVLVVVSFASVIITLIFSHKIAGPLYRLRKAMEELGSGNFKEEFRIRNDDQLQKIAETFNNTIKTIREVVNNIKLNIQELRRLLENIKEEDLPGDKRAILSELKKKSESLDGAVNYFKT